MVFDDKCVEELPWMPSAHGLGLGRNLVKPATRKKIQFKPEETPFHQKYFAKENMMKYEPLAEALRYQEKYRNGTDEEKKEAQDCVDEAMREFRDTSWCSNWNYEKYDLVFYGASGYTGYLIMEYLKRQALPKNKEKFTMAFAGRSYAKTEAARDRVFAGTQWADIPILTCSYDDLVSVIDLAKSARVIVNVAGPYLLTAGDLLVDACIYHKTDYLDVCGEVPYIQRVFKLHLQAKRANVLCCPSAGMACLSDMGIASVARKLKEEYGEEMKEAKSYFLLSGGASSGGTLATQQAMSSRPEFAKVMQDPFAFGGFVPDREFGPNKLTNFKMAYERKADDDGVKRCVPKVRQIDTDINLSKVAYDPKCECWRAPVYFTFFETRIIRRSSMLMEEYTGKPYGDGFNYQAYAWAPDEKAAKGIAKALDTSQKKSALEKEGKYYGQGEGPPLEELEDAWTAVRCYGETPSGKSYKMSFRGLDGYYETARTAVELALTLRFDRLKLPFKGGALTCGVAGGEFLEKRLLESGMVYKLGEWESLDDLPVSGMLKGSEPKKAIDE